MKNQKELQKIFEAAKGEHPYYSFDDFKDDAKDFIKDVKSRSTICHITPSKAGMSRNFNFDRYNMLLNICYNEKFSWEQVYVTGCGMDMHWHLKFSTCEMLCTKKEVDTYDLNSHCSSGKIV